MSSRYVRVTLIDHTVSSTLQIFLFCCAHAHRIQAYLAGSKWGSSSRPKVTVIVSTNCLSAGEALRSVDERNIIKSDFILVSAGVFPVQVLVWGQSSTRPFNTAMQGLHNLLNRAQFTLACLLTILTAVLT